MVIKNKKIIWNLMLEKIKVVKMEKEYCKIWKMKVKWKKSNNLKVIGDFRKCESVCVVM